MKFEFGQDVFEGKNIGYVATKSEFFEFLKCNESEIEEIITDRLEEKEIYQWDEIDIDCRVSSSGSEQTKHVIFLGDTFIQEESFNENMLVRTVRATIFCIVEPELVPVKRSHKLNAATPS